MKTEVPYTLEWKAVKNTSQLLLSYVHSQLIYRFIYMVVSSSIAYLFFSQSFFQFLCISWLSACSSVRIWLINHGLSANKQYFSLTQNQSTVLSVMAYKPNKPKRTGRISMNKGAPPSFFVTCPRNYGGGQDSLSLGYLDILDFHVFDPAFTLEPLVL